MSQIMLKVKKVHELARLPCYAHEGDAGLDLFSVEDYEIQPAQSALIKTGIHLELPPNTEAQIRPRSGLAFHSQVTVLNSPGTIDNGYRGEICVLLINHGSKPFAVSAGARIAQLVVTPIATVNVVEVQVLNESKRGTGFGSTGD